MKDTVSSLTFFFLFLRVFIHSQSLTWAQRVCSDNPFGHLCAGKYKTQIPALEQELSLPHRREESILS